VIKRYSLVTPVLLACSLAAADTLPELGASSGGLAPESGKTTAPIADQARAHKARSALDALIRAYEGGDIGYVRGRLSPAMIGYQRFIDGMAHDVNKLKQIRIHLFDTQVTAGPDMAVIQTGWEKRFLTLAGFTPGLYSGRSMFLLHRDGDDWKVAALAGDNLFATQSGVAGQVRVSPALISCPAPCAPTITITVFDPDIAGQPSASVEVISSEGERETMTLLPSGLPGSFSAMETLDIAGGFGMGNGGIEGTWTALPLNFTVRYLDQNPGNNRPPTYIHNKFRIVP
jgi:hypothetical protein